MTQDALVNPLACSACGRPHVGRHRPSTMEPPCPDCGYIHGIPNTHALDRLDPDGSQGYIADYPGSPIRPTRTEAEQDWCDYMRAKETR